jgi:hypothetical protein
MTRLFVFALLILTLTACARPGDHVVTTDCTWTEHDNRSLDLNKFADRRHLWYDAVTSEDVSIRWADAYFHLSPEYDRQQDQCMEKYFQGIAALHTVDAATVRQYSASRDIGFDLVVILTFGLFYSFAAYYLAGLIRRRFSPEESGYWLLAIAIGVGAAATGVALGSLWAIVMEGIRLNSGHLSYRMFRLPFRRHWAMLFAGGFIVFGLVTLIRSRLNFQVKKKPSLEIFSR